MSNIIPIERIETKIFLIRGLKVMLDADLAELYDVKTKALVQAVKRNADRFPHDFMFRLTKKESEILRSQNVTSTWGGRRYLPVAFTEHGILMLSSVLNSQRAVQVNIQIMRTFTKLKQMVFNYAELQARVDKLEQEYNGKFKLVFNALRQIIAPPEKTKQIGFLADRDKHKGGEPNV